MRRSLPLQSVWIIVKPHAIGDINACLGVAQRLAPEPRIIFEADIIKAGGVAAFLRQQENSPSGFIEKHRAAGKNNSIFPQVIISSHHTASPTSLVLDFKRLSGGKAFFLQLRDPGQSHAMFDLIANPNHVEKISGKNVIETVGVAHRINAQTLAEGRALWQNELSGFSNLPKIAVIVGGTAKSFPDETGGGMFTPEDAARLGKDMHSLAKEKNAALIITNSNRTPEDAWHALCAEIKDVPAYLHHYKLDAAKGNPYFGLLAISDILIPTADSVSMCSEAAYTGKPVYVAGADFKNVRSDHLRLVDQLINRGHIRPVSRIDEPWHNRPEPLDTAGYIAQEAIKRMRSQSKAVKIGE